MGTSARTPFTVPGSRKVVGLPLSPKLRGVLFLVGIFDHRRQETLHFGSPESHLGGFVAAVAIIVVGIFMAHAGVIFWSRRVRIRPKKRSQ
jgi:hypothetical protein